MLSSPEPKETKLNGEIEVKVKAADGTTATVGNTNLNTNTGNNYLHIKNDNRLYGNRTLWERLIMAKITGKGSFAGVPFFNRGESNPRRWPPIGEA